MLAASFSPDGQKLATAGEDRTARLWQVGGELRGHKTGDTLALRLPRLFRWDERLNRFWAGVYAWQRGDVATARSRYEEAFDEVMAVSDPASLPLIALGLAVADAGGDLLTLHSRMHDVSALLDRVLPSQPEVKADALEELGVVAFSELHAPLPASWPLQAAIRLVPRHATAAAHLLECQLALEQYRETARRAQAVLALQSERGARVAVAFLNWSALKLGKRKKHAEAVARDRLITEYKTVYTGKRTGWDFDGIRFALRHKPPRPELSAVLSVLELLDRTKNVNSDTDLSRLVGLAGP